jgi:type I restriction enzyme R subunit
MVGRGTRLCKDLFGPGEDKKNFFIFDFCQNLEFFSQNPDVSDGSAAEPLSTRLFKARLQIIAELDNKLANTPKAGGKPPPPYSDTLTEEQLRTETAALLHQNVAAMQVDNFVVRPQRKYVDKFAVAEAWQQLGPEDFHELTTKVAGLPTELTDDDEEAKRFDLLMLRTQLAILQAKPDYESLKEKIQAIASALEEQSAIPAIKAAMVFIQSVAGEEWWQDVTVPMLETARRKLRLLVKLIPKGQKNIVYTNFEDELGEATTVHLPQVTAGLNLTKFKEKARAFLKAHESHLSLQRLRRNQPLTATDIAELEKMLIDAGGSPELINEAKEESHGLGIFIRSLVGLEHETAIQAFSEFISATTVTPNQIEFINLIIEELTQNGVMEPNRIFESPYKDLNTSGPLGIFPSATLTRLVDKINLINNSASDAMSA